MMLFGLKIVRAVDGGPITGSDGLHSLHRGFIIESIGYIVFGLLGFIWAAFEPRKRAGHDMIAGTVVIHTN
jgi:uncharacterized RDD family membrane protein YckC